MDDLYENIKKRREELGMSQDELARKVGYTSRSTIARIERGDINIPQDKIVLFARALGMLPEYLMGWTDEDGVTISDDDLKTDVMVRLSEDRDLYAIVERAARDRNYAERLKKIAELLEK